MLDEESNKGPISAGSIMTKQNSIDSFENPALDFPACRALPQPNIKNFIMLSDFECVKIYIGNKCGLVSHKQQHNKHAHIYPASQHRKQINNHHCVTKIAVYIINVTKIHFDKKNLSETNERI